MNEKIFYISDLHDLYKMLLYLKDEYNLSKTKCLNKNIKTFITANTLPLKNSHNK